MATSRNITLINDVSVLSPQVYALIIYLVPGRILMLIGFPICIPSFLSYVVSQQAEALISPCVIRKHEVISFDVMP